MSKFSNV